MKKQTAPDDWFLMLSGALALLAGAGLGAVIAGARGAFYGAALGALYIGLTIRFRGRRRAQRRLALARPFPPAWRRHLKRRYDHFARLPASWRARFEDQLKIFIAEKRITGVGVQLNDELRVLVGASAVTLSLGWPNFDWSQLAEVLLYPDDFDRDYTFGVDDISGQAHPWGTVILSAPTLIDSFDDPDDAYHVGLHEFAHLLDLTHAAFDGLPYGPDEKWERRFVALREKEMERMRNGRSVLDSYGANDPVEFLAVAVEAFFETPIRLRRHHDELYELLSSYFAQDTAAWDEARGRKPGGGR